MLYLRVLCLAASLVVVTGFGYFVFFGDSQAELATAQDYFLSGEYQDAEQLVDRLGHQISFAEQQLYKAYLARTAGQLEESDLHLAEAADHPSGSGALKVSMELTLNRMLNAYLSRDPVVLGGYIREFSRLTGETSGWLALFSGLEAYLQQNYVGAIDALRRAGEREYYSPWMETAFGVYFPAGCEKCFIARCQIEQGRWKMARGSLEVIAGEQMEAKFLLGLSYAKEGEALPYDEAVPYYRLAFSYFDDVPVKEEQFREDREAILLQIQNDLYAALRAESYEDLDFYAALMERWGDCDVAVSLGEALSQSFRDDVKAPSGESLEGYALVLAYLLEEGTARDELVQELEAALTAAFEEKDFVGMTSLWEAARWLSPDPARLTAHFADRAIKEVFLGVQGDDVRLTGIRPYLDFWSQMVTDPNQRYQVSLRLVVLAEEMWQRTRERKKAVRLMRIAQRYPVPAHQRFVREKVEKNFRAILQTAIHQDDVAELHDVYDAVIALELVNLDLHNTEDQVELMKEATRLYSEGRHEEAKKKGQWVNRLDAENVEAKVLLGKIAYREFAYDDAYEYLRGVQSDDPEVNMIQGVAFTLVGQIKEGQRLLDKVAKVRPLAEETNLRLGFGLLAQDKPVAALQWLEEVEGHADVVLAGRCVAAFEMQSWSEAVELTKQLPLPYSALDGFQGITVEAYTALGEILEAEEALNILLFSEPEPPDDQFPDYFQAFMREKLDHWNRNYVAAQFYRLVKEDVGTALQYFDKIEDPMPLAEIGRAELLMDEGRNEEARAVLLTILQSVDDVRGAVHVKTRLLPLLGAVHARLGYFVEAWSYYAVFQTLRPQDNSYRADFAKVLMQVRRFDLALEQYQHLRRSFPLRPTDMIAFITCMIHTDRFDLANKTAWEALRASGASLDFQLQLAQLMVITNNRELVLQVLRTLSEQQKRPIEVERQLIRLWLEMANYDEALGLARFRERELLETAEGIKVLVDLYAQQSKFDKARFFAERVAELTPTDSDVADFLARYEREPEAIAQAVKLKKSKLEKMASSPTLRLGMATDLIDRAISAYSAGDISDIRESADLRQARTLLLKVIEKDKGLPQAYYLVGKVYYLLGKDAKAKEAYTEALKLDVSYIRVYQHLALVYEGGQDDGKAIALLRKGVRFDPNNAQLWEQLGGLYLGAGRYEAAVDALRRAIRFMPNEAGPYIRMAAVYLQQENLSEAVAYLEQGLDLSPKDMEAIKLMLMALHDPKYTDSEGDSASLKRQQLLFFDKLQALDPQEADLMRERLGVKVPD